MAVLWWKTIQNLTNSAILTSSSTFTGNNYQVGNPFRGGFSVTIYAGAQPSAATITSGWTSYNSNFLVHILNVYGQNPYMDSALLAQGISYYSSGTNTAINTGTAAWAIMWPTNPSQATIQAATLPSTRFIVVPVTNMTSNGALRLTSTSIVSGSSYSVTDVNMIFGGGSS